METRDDKPRLCRVVVAYRSPYDDPLVLSKGEELRIGDKDSPFAGWIWCSERDGKSGWVPEAYAERRGDVCAMRRDYDATELSISVGEELVVEKEERGWIWCANREGKSGWVPLKNVVLS